MPSPRSVDSRFAGFHAHLLGLLIDCHALEPVPYDRASEQADTSGEATTVALLHCHDEGHLLYSIVAADEEYGFVWPTSKDEWHRGIGHDVEAFYDSIKKPGMCFSVRYSKASPELHVISDPQLSAMNDHVLFVTKATEPITRLSDLPDLERLLTLRVAALRRDGELSAADRQALHRLRGALNELRGFPPYRALDPKQIYEVLTRGELDEAQRLLDYAEQWLDEHADQSHDKLWQDDKRHYDTYRAYLDKRRSG